MPVASDSLDLLRHVSTAPITMQLIERGIRASYMRDPKPLLKGGERTVGPAYTLRFIPMREDLSVPAVLGAKDNAQKIAVEECPTGHVLVIDGLDRTDCGVLGDILVARLKARGVAGAVTDACVRDEIGIVPMGFPVYCKGSTAPPNIHGLTPADRQVPIGCVGVAVHPGDVIVGDTPIVRE